jgi:hypothetical protein
MKIKGLKAVIGCIVLAAGALHGASDYEFDVDSLVGIEGGFSTFDVEKNTPNPPVEQKKYNVGAVGLKIGAESQNYRIYLGIRNYFMPGEYDYFITYGGEFEYLFHFSKSANFFIGINGGIIDGRFTATNNGVAESTTRTFADPYFGGGAGFNFDLGDDYALELGARVMTTSAENTKNNITYKIDSLITGYASFIVKFQMD